MKELFKQYKVQIFLIIYGILSLPVFYGLMGNGLDPSWSYALNKLTSVSNVKFGTDMVFTYGPLGFLAQPLYINSNYKIATFIYFMMWASTMVLFYKLLKNNCNNMYMIGLSLFVMFLGSPANGADLYIQYCVLIALAVLWIDMMDVFAVVFFTISTTIAFFFKFSITVAILGALVLFFLAKVIMKDYKRIWVLFLPCITIPVAYLIYNPSIHGFLKFVKGSWEVSKGFNTAMSISQNDPYVIWMFLLMFIYIAIMLSQIIFKKQKNFYSMLWLAPCLFMSYKHGYVRADGHVVQAYVEILATFSIVILLFDVTSLYEEVLNKTKKGMVQAALIASLLLLALLDYNTNLNPWISLTTRIQKIPVGFYSMNEETYENNVRNLTSIPDGLLDIIGESSYTSYPWEITFIEPTGDLANNFIPLPAFQMYSAYTPYLDNITSNLFTGNNAPEYIIFRFDTIDNRIALMEAPSTWKAIHDNYEISMYDFDNGYYLLKHKENLTNRSGSVKSVNVNKNDLITFDECSEARIHAKLTLWGRFVNTIWKIPEVTAKITYSDGTVRDGRVLLDNLSNGITIKGMPYDYDTLYNAMFSDGANCVIKSIEFSGAGLKYYTDSILIDYIYYDEVKQTDLSYLMSDLDLASKVEGNPDDVNLLLDSKTTDPLLSLNGWAYITNENKSYDIYVKIDDKYYMATKANGQDVIDYFNLSGDVNVRFSLKLPIKGGETIEFILVSGDTYYSLSR